MREDLGLLLQLQQWDLETMRLESELNSWAPQRAELVAKVLQGREQAEELKQKWMRVEVERKELESQIGQLQEQLAKYATQQLQTRKNDEYRAFQTQIDTTGKKISDLETRVLEKMELEDQAHKKHKKTLAANEVIEKESRERIQTLDDLKQARIEEVKERKAKREEFADLVESRLRARYERMFSNKRGHVLVGIDGGTCGGCHIRLPQQLVLSCRSDEMTNCINCGCMLYYSPEMNV
jgi:predicted  nucleic acid-binding Zn-ribbon protein